MKNQSARERVIVTGICGNLGKNTARMLHREMEVIGIDNRDFQDLPGDIIQYKMDIRRRRSRDIFRKSRAGAVVHLGVSYDERRKRVGMHSWNLEVFSSILQFISDYRISKLVLLSNASVYGPHPDNPRFLSEDHPLYGAERFHQIRDIVEIDMLAQSSFWRNPDCGLVILRPVNIVGSVINPLMTYLSLRTPPTCLGFDPMIQLTHEKDVARAIALALQPGIKGVFNIAGTGQMPLSRLLKQLGKKPVALPSSILRRISAMTNKFKLGSIVPGEINYLKHSCMVDTERAEKMLGFRPEHDIKSCIEAVTENALWTS